MDLDPCSGYATALCLLGQRCQRGDYKARGHTRPQALHGRTVTDECEGRPLLLHNNPAPSQPGESSGALQAPTKLVNKACRRLNEVVR